MRRQSKCLMFGTKPLYSLSCGAASSHMPSTLCSPCGVDCEECVEVVLNGTHPSCDMVFGVPWDLIRHPQNIVLGLSTEVREATEKIANLSSDQWL